MADYTETERRILDMWPKFEDGGYVMLGDEVSYDHDENEREGSVSAVCFPGKKPFKYTFALDVEDNGRVSVARYIIGSKVKRPEPRVLDADGVEIKVGDTVWHEDGTMLRVDGFGGIEDGETIVNVHIIRGATQWSAVRSLSLTHIAPDSWERLEEDALKGVCEYAGAERKPGTIDAHTCCGCRFDEDGDGPTCEKQMALDIIRRAKALAKKEAAR